MLNNHQNIKGQGAVKNTLNRFDQFSFESDEEEFRSLKTTQFLEVFPKSIVNAVKSPDLRMDYSMNPYQGC